MKSARPTRRAKWPLLVCLGVGSALLVVLAVHPEWVPGGQTLVQRMRGKATIEDRLMQYGPQARARLQPDFARVGVNYPPPHLTLLGLKQEKKLQLYAPDHTGKMRLVRSYKVLAASGHAGPKLREGDFQVPEGCYKIESLNPNSSYHLSLRVNYPSQDDRRIAEREGRTNLGGDIMIHGSNASVGCLAMGDPAAEELFVLVAETGLDNVDVVLSPADLRRVPLKSMLKLEAPAWVGARYRELDERLRALPES